MRLYSTGCLKGGGNKKKATFALVLQTQTCRKLPGAVIECENSQDKLDIGKQV